MLGRSLSQIKRRFKLMKTFISGHVHLGFEALVIKVGRYRSTPG
jgi:hypothetical protein